jgi:hypothetical protein
MRELMFERLRELVLARIGSLASSISTRTDAVPIEQTDDGWICLMRSGQVAHVGRDSANDEPVRTQSRATALVGNLAIRFPIATWFVPIAERAVPCPSCGGTGIVANLPADLRSRAVRSCGGLGWVPAP